METEKEVSPMPVANLIKLLIEKGLITQTEFMQKLSAERAGYQAMLGQKRTKEHGPKVKVARGPRRARGA